ncbi:unnamed protein product [Chilo suppressalis]|uniref:CHK kinase-like domain-containing protein n=1 Tax=Chilo suppressalis TaxID=168631 RepID=A0ABN8LDV3_CHISP|nr:unnamed protein product [Chilo suppressalis]
MTSLQEYIKIVMADVNSVLKLTDFSYKQKEFKNIGQNYFGIVVPVVVSGEDKGNKVTLSLVLKLAPTDERYRASGAVTRMFAREMYVYSTLLTNYRKFLLDYPSDLQYASPKCYYICEDFCKEVIVMQNMCAEGYKTYVDKVFLDHDHMIESLKALAIFHSLSFVLNERDPSHYDEAAKMFPPLMEKYNKRFVEVILDRLEKVIELFENTEYLTLLTELKTNLVKYLEAATLSTWKLCICHGDVWKENILYKYENHKPVSACLIDYQTTRICSAAFDTLYLITISSDTNLRRAHYKNFLDIYYEQLAKALRSAGIDPDLTYSRSMFDDDLNTVAPACFIVANTALWLSNGLQEEGHVRSKQVFKTQEEKTKAVVNFKTVVRNIIDDYKSYGYFANK